MKGSAVAECGARRGILNRGDLEEKHIPDARCLHVLVGGRAPRSHLSRVLRAALWECRAANILDHVQILNAAILHDLAIKETCRRPLWPWPAAYKARCVVFCEETIKQLIFSGQTHRKNKPNEGYPYRKLRFIDVININNVTIVPMLMDVLLSNFKFSGHQRAKLCRQIQAKTLVCLCVSKDA